MDDNDWLEPKSTNNEEARLAELYSLNVLDTEAEYRFDSLSSLALEIIGGSNCLISLVDEHRQWCKSSCTDMGVDVSREHSFCAQLINNTATLMQINNTRQDTRFKSNPLVIAEPNIAAYLGVALHGPNGYIVGSLCVLDTIEREFTAQNIQHLRAIAKRVEVELQLVKSDLPKYQAKKSADLYDPITKLPNKQYFIQKLQQHLQIQHIHEQYGQIAVIQIQRFRHIARIYQDAFCNQVLLEFSHRIRTSLPNDAIIAKLSNDKYIVFLPAVFAQSQVDYFSHVKEILEKPVLHNGTPVYINAQVGLTFISKHTETLEEHISRCLLAMQNPDTIHESFSALDNDYERLSLRAIEIENHLHQAINQHAFTMVYQPIVESYSETMVALEALVRWRWKPNEFLSPSEFIPIAEAAGLILPLSQWILKTACIEFAAFQDEHQAPLYLSVNISHSELMANDFVEQVINACDIAKLSYNRIQLEITEHAILNDFDGAVIQLRRLHDKGVRIAIDDFGTGHSSLQYLHKLPVDVVKIDQTFIRNIHQSAELNADIQGIIALSHELGKLITAEGIETFEQAEFLRKENINTGQGWYYGKPMDIKTLLLKTSDLHFM